MVEGDARDGAANVLCRERLFGDDGENGCLRARVVVSTRILMALEWNLSKDTRIS